MKEQYQEINLIKKELGNVEYQIIRFPDGQVHIRLGEIDRKKEVKIVCRITDASELFTLMQIGDVLNRQCVTISVIDVKYLMGARMDRVMDFNEPFTLKIIADCINSINAKKIIILDPHSHRALELINNSEKYNLLFSKFGDYVCLPDAGAAYRNGHMANAIYCSKVRDIKTGKLSGFKIENPEVFTSGSIIVIDDLCDGGGTFLGIHTELKKLNPSKITLAITHSIQYEGLKKIASIYDEVITTNSFMDWDIVFQDDESEFVEKIKVINIL